VLLKKNKYYHTDSNPLALQQHLRDSQRSIYQRAAKPTRRTQPPAPQPAHSRGASVREHLTGLRRGGTAART